MYIQNYVLYIKSNTVHESFNMKPAKCGQEMYIIYVYHTVVYLKFNCVCIIIVQWHKCGQWLSINNSKQLDTKGIDDWHSGVICEN